MKSLLTACGGALLAAALATPAAAQLQGTYTGTSADGSGVSFAVGTDSGNGLPAVTGAGINFIAPCKKSTETLYQGEGYGMTADIISHKVTNVSAYPNFYIKFSLKFAANGSSATGTVMSIAPYLNPATTPPKNALFCESASQAMTVTYSGSDVRAPAVHGTYVYDRKGRIIGQETH